MSVAKFWKEALAWNLAGGHAQQHAGMAMQLSPVAKLKRTLGAGLFDVSVPATVPTITQLSADASNNSRTTSISGGVTVLASDVIAGTDRRFTMVAPSAWVLTATSNNGVKFYSGPATGGTDIGGTGVVAFYCDGPIVEICNRHDESWQIFVEGKPVNATPMLTATGTAYGLTRTVITNATRKRRKYIAYGQTTGFYGVGIGASDTLEPIDSASEITMSVMSDSYGGTTNIVTGGPFLNAAMRLGINLVRNSPGGGSGYDTLGNGSRPNALTRLPTLLNTSAEIVLTSLGINDPATIVNAYAYHAQVRTTLPSALLICTGPWTPNAGALAIGATKRDQIFTAFSALTGPLIFVDNVAGTWWSKDKFGNIRTGVAGSAGWQTSANNAIYIGDGTHPTSPAGCEYLDLNLANAIRAAVMSLPD